MKYYASYLQDGKVFQEVCNEVRVMELLACISNSDFGRTVSNFRVYPEGRIYDTVFCLSELSKGVVIALALDSILVALDSGKRCVVKSADFINLSSPLDFPMTLFISFSKCNVKAVEAFRVFRETGKITVGYESLAGMNDQLLAWIEDSLSKGSKRFIFQELEQLSSLLIMLLNKFFADLKIALWYGYSVDRGSKVMNLDTFRVEEWNGHLDRFIPVVGVSDSVGKAVAVDYFIN